MDYVDESDVEVFIMKLVVTPPVWCTEEKTDFTVNGLIFSTIVFLKFVVLLNITVVYDMITVGPVDSRKGVCVI